jgi:hypothetical protein
MLISRVLTAVRVDKIFSPRTKWVEF